MWIWLFESNLESPLKIVLICHFIEAQIWSSHIMGTNDLYIMDSHCSVTPSLWNNLSWIWRYNWNLSFVLYTEICGRNFILLWYLWPSEYLFSGLFPLSRWLLGNKLWEIKLILSYCSSNFLFFQGKGSRKKNTILNLELLNIIYTEE